ncbi:MAG: hypothetical protein AAGI30_07395 [Planctomycetota bacterium]
MPTFGSVPQLAILASKMAMVITISFSPNTMSDMPPRNAESEFTGRHQSTPDMAQDLEQAYHRLRVSLASLLHSRGDQMMSSRAVAKELGVNHQVAWQLASIATQTDCSIGLELLPGTKSLQMLVDRCRAMDGNEEMSEALHESVKAMEDSIERHAGGRQSVRLLAATFGTEGLQKRSELLRRDAYRAQCALLGLHAKVQVQGQIFVPYQDKVHGERLLKANYRYFHDLVRLRADRPCRLLYMPSPWNTRGEHELSEDEMPGYVKESMALDEEHTTVAPDELQTTFVGSAAWITLSAGPMGETVPVSIAFTGSPRSSMQRGIRRYRSRHSNTYTSACYCHVPTETIYIDRLMHKSLSDHRQIRETTRAMCFDASTSLPVRSSSLDSGDASFLFELEESSPLTPADLKSNPMMPSLTGVIRKAAGLVGASIDDLVGVRYPVAFVTNPTLFTLKRTLPQRP